MRIDYEKRIFGLDLMRAVAIIMVMCSHTLWIVPEMRGVTRKLFSIFGILGVDVFFVLSGFLIGRILYKMYISKDFSFKEVTYFWVRRWFRTLPNYYLTLVINILVAIYIGNQLPDELWKYGFFLHNFSSQLPWFYPESWSLSVEEFAYILGPLLLYLVLFFRKNASRSRSFLLVTLFILILFILSKLMYNQEETIRHMRHWTLNVKSIVIYRIDAIYYGVLAAYISIVKPKFWYNIRYVACTFGILALISMNFLIPIKGWFITEYPQFWNVWYFVIKSIAIVCTLPLLSQIKSAPKLIMVPITYVSILSYAIYVFHYSIIMQLMKYLIPSEPMAGFDLVIYLLVYVLITFVVSYLVYRLYEKPMTDLRDSPRIKKYFK
ncbi:acyltransferase family protein [Psychroserpens jangbogonensis]|uniref:acyltransferase family protein n=1 Tax=Psychroserpens jangbogonensis TaxID=1484460 RepID=UPI00068B65CC|nr:acyltransferase [Psychroserpens jangbogonensis]